MTRETVHCGRCGRRSFLAVGILLGKWIVAVSAGRRGVVAVLPCEILTAS